MIYQVVLLHIRASGHSATLLNTTLLDTVLSRQPVQSVDDLDCQLAVGRLGDVFLLYRRIDLHLGRFCIASVQTHRFREDLLHAGFANTLSKVH